jgi:ribonuclease P protein component
MALKRLHSPAEAGFFPLPRVPATLLRAGTPGPRTRAEGPFRALVEEIMGEANLPAQKAQAHADPRVPGTDVDPGGPGRHQVPSPEGPAQADRLTWRVRDRSTFSALAAASRRRRGPISLACLVGEENIPPRVAYAVGRKVGGAVTRNRVRRRLRASVARHRSHLRPGAAYLFGAGQEAATAPFAELEAAVGELLAGRPR